jgi:hypothetical protein
MIPRPGDLHVVRLDPADRSRIVVGPKEAPHEVPQPQPGSPEPA